MSRGLRRVAGVRALERRLQGDEGLVMMEVHRVGLEIELDPFDPGDPHPSEARVEPEVGARLLARALRAGRLVAGLVDRDLVVDVAEPAGEGLRAWRAEDPVADR